MPQRLTDLEHFAVFGFVPYAKLRAAERRDLVGRPEGRWVHLATLSARSPREAIRKTERLAWARDARATEWRAERVDVDQRSLFDSLP